MFYKLLDKNVVKLSYNSYKPNNQVDVAREEQKLNFSYNKNDIEKKLLLLQNCI